MTAKDELQHMFPFGLEVKEGQIYKWCGCGESKTQPLCDRQDCGDKCLAYKAVLAETVYFCGCKETKDPPFCDGSHARVLLEAVKKRG